MIKKFIFQNVYVPPTVNKTNNKCTFTIKQENKLVLITCFLEKPAESDISIEIVDRDDTTIKSTYTIQKGQTSTNGSYPFAINSIQPSSRVYMMNKITPSTDSLYNYIPQSNAIDFEYYEPDISCVWDITSDPESCGCNGRDSQGSFKLEQNASHQVVTVSGCNPKPSGEHNALRMSHTNSTSYTYNVKARIISGDMNSGPSLTINSESSTKELTYDGQWISIVGDSVYIKVGNIPESGSGATCTPTKIELRNNAWTDSGLPAYVEFLAPCC